MNVATAVDSTHVELIPEDDGTFSVIVPDLPGVGSCGDTEAEAGSDPAGAPFSLH